MRDHDTPSLDVARDALSVSRRARHRGTEKFLGLFLGVVAAIAIATTLTLLAQAPQGGPPGGRGAAAGQTVEKIRELKPNLYMITGGGANTLVRITTEGLIVVDTKNPSDENYKRLMEEIASVAKQPVKYVINTHHHPDHTGGNKVLQPSVVKIVAQENAPGLQRKQAAAQKSEDAQAYADTTYKTDWKVDLGSEVVSARHYGPGHTGGDGVIFFQRANVVHMGDLMSHQRHPRVDRPAGASIRNWLVSLEKVVKDHNADTVYVFGHSKVGAPVTGPKGDLLALRDYFSAMLDYVQKGIKAGKSADEIVKAGLPQFAANEGQPQLQVAYDELTAKKA